MSIQVRNLTHIYSEGLPHQTVALSEVSFDIEDGEFVGIIGHTGSGKSTLVQHLNGLLKPNSGSVFVGGTEITKGGVFMRDIRRKIGLVFQYPEYQLFEETVHKDIAFGPINLGLSKEETDARVIEAVGLVGLDYAELSSRSPFDLSTGQKRRVAIAGVIAMKPEVLILDEPTAGLDPKAHKDILDMIQEVHKRTNNITILISHNMSDIAALTQKILVMEKGRLVLSGTPKDIFGQRSKLEQMGLDVPPVTDLMVKLFEAGIPVGTEILTIEDAETELLNFMRTSS